MKVEISEELVEIIVNLASEKNPCDHDAVCAILLGGVVLSVIPDGNAKKLFDAIYAILADRNPRSR